MNRYKDIRILREQEDNKTLGPRYKRGTKYPEVSFNENDIYVITTQGDRYDLLAQQYYGDYTMWWIIAIANVGDYTSEIPLNSLFIPVGTQLRIPSNIQDILFEYTNLNRL
jgi:hypothetical protein